MRREVAQAGSAPGLGPGGRRFESCLPDKTHHCLSNGGFFYLQNTKIVVGFFLLSMVAGSLTE